MKKATIDNNPINTTDNIPPINFPDNNPGIIDVTPGEFKEVKEENSVVTEETPIPPSEEVENKKEYLILKTATPYNATVMNAHGVNVGTIYFLCKDGDDKLFILMRNYILNSEEDKMSIWALPFYHDYDEEFASGKILNSLLNQCLDTYVSGMEFSVDDSFKKISNPSVYLKASSISTKEKVVIKMTADIFSCMSFIDSYVFDKVDNEHDLTLATVAGSKVLDTSVEFFVVDKIESIVSMAPAEVHVKRKGLAKLFGTKNKKYNTTLGIVLKVSRYISNNEREIVHILTPFDVGVEYDESKFRGNTIDNIQSNYYGDSDQYVGTLMISSVRLLGVDKEYMVIRGKSKDKRVKIFLFDSSVQQELKSLIDRY